MTTAKMSIGRLSGAGSRVEIGDHDITNAVRGLDLHARVGEPTEVQLDLVIIDTAAVDATDIRILVPPRTRDALIALGWTPPPDQPAGIRYWMLVAGNLMVDLLGTLPDDIHPIRGLKLGNAVSPPDLYLVEVADRNAPAEAEGQLLSPTFSRDHCTGRVEISDYGLLLNSVT